MLQVNGETFEGVGSSKKQAKHEAARKALQSFLQFENAYEAHVAMQLPGKELDFTNDALAGDSALFKPFQIKPETEEATQNGAVSTMSCHLLPFESR